MTTPAAHHIMRRLNQNIVLAQLGWDYVLSFNIAIAGGLGWSHTLGYNSCTCDRGAVGYEWWPGCKATPFEIQDREWLDDEHDFEPGDVKAPVSLNGPWCVNCGRDAKNWRHRFSADCDDIK